MTENEIGKVVADCAVRLHTALDPKLINTVYAALLAHTFNNWQSAGLVKCKLTD
ncbi:MAG: hypothetical protein HZB37_06040 [Planctomycetes bacterium]|nr:hypothetical protein [Planctomycetota bacterium]